MERHQFIIARSQKIVTVRVPYFAVYRKSFVSLKLYLQMHVFTLLRVEFDVLFRLIKFACVSLSSFLRYHQRFFYKGKAISRFEKTISRSVDFQHFSLPHPLLLSSPILFHLKLIVLSTFVFASSY